MPYHRGPRVAQLVLTRSLVVMSQQKVVLKQKGLLRHWRDVTSEEIKTYVETGEAVPAEDVLAPLAHHLGTAFVLFDRNVAHGAAFDEIRVERYPRLLSLALLGQLLAVVLARQPLVPLQFAVAAEVRGAGGAEDALRRALLRGTHRADRLAARPRAPRSGLV